MRRPMRVLVIGAGVYVTGRGTDGLGTVLPALAEASRTLSVESVTVAATRAENREVVERVTRSINEILGTNLRTAYVSFTEAISMASAEHAFDCAIVVVPDDKHYEIGSRLLAAGLHILMVKPLAPSVADARRLETLRDDRNLYGVVEFHKRWDESNLAVRRLLEDDCLGRLAYIDVEYSQRRTVPIEHFRAWAARSNIFQYLAVHYVDLIYFLTGFSPVRAMGVGTSGILRAMGIETWDSIHALVEWRSPSDPTRTLLSGFSTNWIDPRATTAMSDQKYRIVGEAGRIDCDQKNRGLELTTELRGSEVLNPYFSQFLSRPGSGQRFAGYGFQSFLSFLQDVQSIVRNEACPGDFAATRPTFRQALVSTAVVEAVNRSLESRGEWRAIDAEG
jgi:predicted dehydrogenase